METDLCNALACNLLKNSGLFHARLENMYPLKAALPLSNACLTYIGSPKWAEIIVILCQSTLHPLRVL